MQKPLELLQSDGFDVLIYRFFFPFKQEQNLLELSPYQTPTTQMMIKYISSFANHLKKEALLTRPSFLGLEESVRQDMFIYLCQILYLSISLYM